MTLDEKLTQLRLTTMAQKLETMTQGGSDQNLSFAAALERLADWNCKPATGTPSSDGSSSHAFPRNRRSTSSSSPIINPASRSKTASSTCSISTSSSRAPMWSSLVIPILRHCESPHQVVENNES